MTIFNQIKVLIIAGSLIGLSACSPNSGNNENSQPVNDNVVRQESAKSGLFTGANDFGIFPANATSVKLVTFTLKNNGTEDLIGPAVLESSSAFTLTYSNCPAVLGKTKSCTIKVTLDPRILPSGSYSTNLTFDTAQVSLIAIKEAPAAPTGPAIQYLAGSTPISSLDFGAITDKQNVLKTITIKNISAGSINELATLTGNYVFSYDSCSGKAIAKNASCSIKITLNGAGKNGDVLGNLSYAGEDLALSGNVTSISSGGGAAGSPNIVFSQDNNVVSGTVDQGTLYPSEGKQVILTLKNTGTIASIVDTAVSNNPMFQIVSNQCVSKSLAVNATCQVRVLISGQNTTVYGVKTSDIAFAGASVKLSINILDPAGIATYVPGYSSYGSCSAAEPCDGSGTQVRSLNSCQKMINGVPVSGGTLADCSAFNIPANLQTTCLSPAGDKVIEILNGDQTIHCAEGSNTAQNILSTVCDFGFHNENNVCVADVITYTANYSAYGACSAIQPCDGQGLKNRTIESCQKYRNGVPEAGGQVSDCASYSVPANLQAVCDSPAGDIVSDILDLGIPAGTLTVTCPAGGILPGTTRVASCNSGFEQDGEQCIKLNNLQVNKSSADLGSISVTGLTAPISCDLSCSGINSNIRRDKTVTVLFTANPSNKYAFDNFSGDNATCVSNQCDNISLSSNKSLTVNTHQRKLVVMQETAGYSLSATGSGLFVTTAPTPTAGFTQAKAYYVENNNNFGVSISVVGGTNVNTGWYIDDVKQPAPVGSTVSKIITADTVIHATTGPNQQACGNVAGDYFGVAAGQGKQTWNATTGAYGTRCIPNNSSSCISGTFDDHGTQNNYIYRTATLFPASDSQDPDPTYPYASGACVKNSIYCGDNIPHSTNAFRYSFSGENPYQSCQFDCEAGYKYNAAGTACIAKQLFVVGSTTSGNDLHRFNFDDNTLTKVSSLALNNGFNLLTTDAASSQLYYQAASTGTVYKYDVNANTNTAIMDGASTLASQINNAYATTDSGYIYFIAGSFSNGTEIWRSPLNGTAATQPTMLDVFASGTSSGFNQSNSIFIPGAGGWVTILRAANATSGTEIASLNSFGAWNTTAGVVVKDLISGATSSIDTATTPHSGVSYDSYTYFVGTNATVGTEIFRVFTSSPAAANYINMANVAAGATGSSPGLLNIWNNRLFYKATVAGETELYYTSNLTSSTPNFTKVELVPGSGSAATGVSSFTDMKLVGNKMYVSLSRGDNSLGQELYVITEAPAGTFTMTLAADINASGGSVPRWFETDGKNLYFIANNGTSNNLYMHDGTTLRNLSSEKGLTIGNPAFNGLRLLVK